eukprot:6407385-Amphidinium_carterae.1
MIDKGWAMEYNTLEELLECHGRLGGACPLNKLGLITKVRTDGTLKHRLVWDLRRSGVNALYYAQLKQSQHILLPRLCDAVADYLDVAGHFGGTEPPLLSVADVSDAFHLIPVHPEKVVYESVCSDGKFFAFLVLIFGSAVAPTAWGRVGAILARFAQLIVPNTTTRIEKYVDDPLIVSAGTHIRKLYARRC